MAFVEEKIIPRFCIVNVVHGYIEGVFKYPLTQKGIICIIACGCRALPNVGQTMKSLPASEKLEKNLNEVRKIVNDFQPVRFGKYLLLDKIAVGGMAELFRAKILGVKGFEKIIAVKRILPHLCTEEDLVTAFIDEAKLAALLSHQCTIQIYDFGNIKSSYFIAMEYIFGRDLRLIAKKCKEKGVPLPLEFSLFIVSKVCAGLDYAHGLKNYKGEHLSLVHRDISPQNVIVTYEGDVKIVDFGIAKAATRSVKTQVGMIKGKVAYMSPEQAEGYEIDYRSDIFSTGILMYELVTGKRMFKGDTLLILNKVRQASFQPAEELAPDLPPKVFEILNRALARDREERYSSCGEMQFDIAECIREYGFNPSSTGLSRFMKDLFVDEIQEEHRAMRNAAELAARTEKEQLAQDTGKNDLVGRLLSGGNRLLLAGVAAGLVLIASALYFFVGQGEGPVPKGQVAPSERSEAADATRPVETVPSGETTIPKAGPPETGPAAAGPEDTETGSMPGSLPGPSVASRPEGAGSTQSGADADIGPRTGEATEKPAEAQTPAAVEPATPTTGGQPAQVERAVAGEEKKNARALFDDAVRALDEKNTRNPFSCSTSFTGRTRKCWGRFPTPTAAPWWSRPKGT